MCQNEQHISTEQHFWTKQTSARQQTARQAHQHSTSFLMERYDQHAHTNIQTQPNNYSLLCVRQLEAFPEWFRMGSASNELKLISLYSDTRCRDGHRSCVVLYMYAVLSCPGGTHEFYFIERLHRPSLQSLMRAFCTRLRCRLWIRRHCATNITRIKVSNRMSRLAGRICKQKMRLTF